MARKKDLGGTMAKNGRMDTKRFRTGRRPDQPYLFPPAVTDWLPAKHPVYTWNALVEELDLTAIYAAYRPGKGQPPYDPLVLVKILVYGYAQGIRSSRRLERACYDDVGFRVLTGNLQPDFWTIAAFRRRHLAALGELLGESIRLARTAGLVRAHDVAVDGTKIQANASKHRAMSYQRMEQEEDRLQQEIAAYLQALEDADRGEDAELGPEQDGWTVPDALAEAQKRRATIRAAKARLEAEARARAEAKQAERTATAEAKGKPAPPPPADPPRPDPKAQSNFTDPDSRIMRNSDKAFVQAYNAQAAVDAETQIILAADVTNQAADNPHLLSVVDRVRAHLGRPPAGILADAGYWSEKNLTGLAQRGIAAFIPPEKLRHRDWKTRRPPRGRLPRNLSLKDRMRRVLQTKAGRRRYRRRQISVEPVFGYLKSVLGCRQFLLRSLEKVRQEWRFHCAVANLSKILRKTALPG